MSVLFKVIYNQIEDKEKTRVKSEMEIREIKVKSEKETRKAKAVEKEMKVKSKEKIRKAKEDAKHSARQERTAASQKIAAAASKNKLNLKKSDEVAAGLKKQLTQEKNASLPPLAWPRSSSWRRNRPSTAVYGRRHGLLRKSIGT